MAAVVRVTILCPNGHRQIVNSTPNSSILQILEEVCQKQNINPDDFDLCHYNKPLDLSLPLRFANLSNNAQLELQPVKIARKDCLVTVGLHLESGERIMKDFLPSTTVWDVVEQCRNTQSEKIEEKGEPVCIYMRQKLIGDAMKNTTLRSLGLTKGSATIRLIYRNPEDLCDQAHISAPLLKPSTFSDSVIKMEDDVLIEKSQINSQMDNSSKSVSNITLKKQDLGQDSSLVNKKMEIIENPSVKTEYVTKEQFNRNAPSRERNVVDNKNAFNSLSHKEMSNTTNMEVDNVSMDQDSYQEKEIGAVHYIGGRHAVIYSLDDISEVKKAELPDEFFELTIDDIKYLLEEYKNARLEIENQPLLTKEMRNKQLLRKLGRFKQTVIRVCFPERLVLQAVFGAEETIQDVCDFIRNYLDDQSLDFYLYTTPPKEKKDPTKSLIESLLIPAAMVYFGCDKNYKSYLTNSLKNKVSDPRAVSLAAYESRKQAMLDETEELNEPDESLTMPPETTEKDYKAPGPSFSQPSSSVRSSEKIPKWLKLSKK